jgi:hypothetical protein
MADVQVLELENVRIGFKNFEGREGMYNKAGDRSFAVFLDHGLAEQLAAEGWNIKFPQAKDNIDPEEDTRQPHLQVSVGFEYYPPKVYLISNGNPTRLGEDEVGMLDWAEIENVDLIIRPYEWTVRQNSGIKAYLKEGFFTIVTNKFAEKYGI